MSITSQTVNAQLPTPNSPSSQFHILTPRSLSISIKQLRAPGGGLEEGGHLGPMKTYRFFNVFTLALWEAPFTFVDIAFTSRSHRVDMAVQRLRGVQI